MKRRGFTIVELIITITIMGILLVLVVVNVNSSQVRSRDEERKADIAAIQDALETYYSSGNGSAGASLGVYPNTVTAFGSEAAALQTFRDIDKKSLLAPGSSSIGDTLRVATNTTQTPAGVAPQPTAGQYVYQPISVASNGAQSLCSAAITTCRKYNLFYRSEADNTVQMVRSRNQ